MAQLPYVANYWNYCEAPWYDIVVKKFFKNLKKKRPIGMNGDDATLLFNSSKSPHMKYKQLDIM